MTDLGPLIDELHRALADELKAHNLMADAQKRRLDTLKKLFAARGLGPE